MDWSDIQQAYPNEWLSMEALVVKTTPTHQRTLPRVVLIERCAGA